jgi:hypothetical protein
MGKYTVTGVFVVTASWVTSACIAAPRNKVRIAKYEARNLNAGIMKNVRADAIRPPIRIDAQILTLETINRAAA